jgi:thiol-disulfide isomerase/thioredoxin
MRYLLFIIVLGAILLTTGCVSQNQNPVPATATVYFFYGEECPHCHTVMPFIESLSEKYPEVDFLMLETWHNETNAALFRSLNQELGIEHTGVPEVIVVGNSTPLIGSREIPAHLEEVLLEQIRRHGT